MSNTRRGLPLTSSRTEKIFPVLTPAQINRIEAHGHIRAVQSGELLVEQGDINISFFVVITGELEIVRPFAARGTWWSPSTTLATDLNGTSSNSSDRRSHPNDPEYRARHQEHESN